MVFHARNIHWLAPVTMVLALFGSLILAIGHHLFYAGLRGQEIPGGSYRIAGKSIHKQQINTAVGLIIALLIRTFLSIAVSTACVQVFWRSMRNKKKSPTLSELDCATSTLDNVFRLFDVKFGWKYPLFAGLAIIFWCIPIATVFTPGTLSVTTASVVANKMLAVPQFDFTTFNFVAGLDQSSASTNDFWQFQGPSQPLRKLASTAMTFGQILPITSPAPNASWTMNFPGPALQCFDLTIAEQDRFWVNIWNAYGNGTDARPQAFWSWVPWSISALRDPAGAADDPDFELPIPSDAVLDKVTVPPGPMSVTIHGPASLFIAVLPGMDKIDFYYDNKGLVVNFGVGEDESTVCHFPFIRSITDPINSSECVSKNHEFTLATTYFKDSSLLRCNLVNSSYAVEFNYSSSAQEIRVLSQAADNAPVVRTTDYFVSRIGDASEHSECETFGVYHNVSGVDSQDDSSCVFDVSAIRQLSYQGIMGAFNELIIGSIGRDEASSSVLRTVLAQTVELSPLQVEAYKDPSSAYLQTLISSNASQLYSGLVKPQLPAAHGDLRSTLEQLFQNFTISLLADPYFQPNYSSPFAPPELTNVSVPEYQTLYDYDPETLWLAYGISMFFATLAVAAGIVALWLNGASYSNSPSTIVRISQAAELSVEVLEQDRSGQDPLPKYLRCARLELAPQVVHKEAHAGSKATAEQQSLVGSSGTSSPPTQASDSSEPNPH